MRIVVRRNRCSRRKRGYRRARPRPPGAVIHFNAAGAGAKIVEGIFGIDAAFDGVAFELNVALGHAQRLTHRDHDLLPHQIDAGDFFRDRVLDLDALVHFRK